MVLWHNQYCMVAPPNALRARVALDLRRGERSHAVLVGENIAPPRL
jgi:hypothetical protein